jgi:hypothetical protein
MGNGLKLLLKAHHRCKKIIQPSVYVAFFLSDFGVDKNRLLMKFMWGGE